MEKLCSRGEADDQKDQCPLSQHHRIDGSFLFGGQHQGFQQDHVSVRQPSEDRMTLRVTLLRSSCRSRCMLKSPVMNNTEELINLLKSSDNSEKNIFVHDQFCK